MKKKKGKRPKLETPETIEEVLARSGEQRFSKWTSPIPRRVWRDAVGLRIAEKTEPVTVEKGVLTVRVTTNAWAQEIAFVEHEICTRLRASRFSVDKLRFRVEALLTPQRPPERVTFRTVPDGVPLPPSVSKEMANVEDKELRSILSTAASRNLAYSENSD